MPKLKTSFMAVVLWLTIICSASLHAAVDMFLDLGPTMPGESRDTVHTNQVDVLAWSWGVSNTGTTHRGSGAGAGINKFQVLNVTKYVDKASAPLMSALARETRLDKVTLIVRKTGTPVEYIKVILTNVWVTSVSTGGSGGEDRFTENISLTYATLQIDYVPTRFDGTADKTVSFNWDVSNNSGVTPTPVVGFGSSLIYTNGSQMAKLTWPSTNGANYQVWATTNLGSTFQAYGSPISSGGNGGTTLIVPANALQMFFRIQTLPSQ
ncbi:MAG: type VI secretion system tube protein Hcp [Verrucomicrobiota bacterium]